MSAPGVPTPGNGLVLPSMPYNYQFSGAPNGGADQGAFQGATDLSQSWYDNPIPGYGQTMAGGVMNGSFGQAGQMVAGSDLTAMSRWNQDQAGSSGLSVDPNLMALARAYGNGTAYDSAGVSGAGSSIMQNAPMLGQNMGLLGLGAKDMVNEIPGAGQGMGYFGAEIGPNLEQSRSYEPYVKQALNEGFDPQSSIYDTLRQQNTDQSASNMGMTLGSSSTSPYAAGVMNRSNQDFNTSWQQNMLDRMQRGASTANTLEGASSQASGRAAQDASGIATLAGAQGTLANAASTLTGAQVGAGQGMANMAQTGAGIQQSVPAAALAALQGVQNTSNQTAQASAQDAAAYTQSSDAAAQAGAGIQQSIGNFDMGMMSGAQGLKSSNDQAQQQSISDFLSYLSGGTQATAVQDQAIANLNSSALSSSQQQNTQYQQLLSLIGGGIGFALPNGLSSLPKIPGT